MVSSMTAILSQGGHSSQVKMRLLVHGLTVPVVQLGPDFLLVDVARDLPAGDATLVLQVDSGERCWNVRLPDGNSASSRRVAIVARA